MDNILAIVIGTLAGVLMGIPASFLVFVIGVAISSRRAAKKPGTAVGG